jgi:hypothetical protein
VLLCERAPFDNSTNRSRSRRQVLIIDRNFSIKGQAVVLHVGRTQCFRFDRRSHSRGGGMIQISTRIFVALTAALVATGSLLAFGWFMVNSAINRIVLLEVRVETLEKVLGSNRFDDQKAHRPPSGINKAGARCARIVPYAACGCHATPLRTGEKCPHDCSRVSRARYAVHERG